MVSKKINRKHKRINIELYYNMNLEFVHNVVHRNAQFMMAEPYCNRVREIYFEHDVASFLGDLVA